MATPDVEDIQADGSGPVTVPPGSGNLTLDTQPQRDEPVAPQAPDLDLTGQRESYHSNVVPGGDSAGAVSASRVESGQTASMPPASEIPVPPEAELMQEDLFDDAMLNNAESLAKPMDFPEWRK